MAVSDSINSSTPNQIYDVETNQNDSNSQNLLVKPVKDLRLTNLRWAILFLATFTNVGAYYAYDNPGPLQEQIKDTFKVNNATYGLLYTLTIFPNFIIPFFGGLFIDFAGSQITMIVTSLIVVAGQIVTTFGAGIHAFWLMVVGRIIFGLGYVILENSLINILANWFISKELSFSWGFARTILRVTSAANASLSPRIYKVNNDLYAPFLMGTFLTMFSFICVMIVIFIDRIADRRVGKKPAEHKAEKITFAHIKLLPKLFWLILILSLLGYTTFYTFTSNVNSLFVTRFGFIKEEAGDYIMIIYITAAICSPIVGLVVDGIGRRVHFLTISMLLLFAANAILAFLGDTETGHPNFAVIPSLVLFGLFYSSFSTVIWPAIPLVVKPEAVGTAVGLMTSTQAMVQAIFTEVIGLIHDHTEGWSKGYFWTQITHCIVVFMAIVCVLVLFAQDSRTGKRLALLTKFNREKLMAEINETPAKETEQ